MAIAMVEAARLAKANRARFEELEDRHVALTARVGAESGAQEQVRRAVFDEVLVPFRDLFAAVKNVDLVELDALSLSSGAELPQVEMAAVRLSAFGTLGAFAGGAVLGGGAGAGAFTAVGAFATASTGTSIAGLSGAAATKATLAFLGGGSLAAGGGGVAAGTVVLGGVVAVPVLAVGAGYVVWKGRSARAAQQEVVRALDEAEADLAAVELRMAGVLDRGRRGRGVLADLRLAVLTRLPGLAQLVEHNSDYATYAPEQRVRVATVVNLVITAVAVMRTPLEPEPGVTSELFEGVLADARRRLDDLDGGDGVAA